MKGTRSLKTVLGHPAFRFLASLKLAVVSLLSLAAVLAVATVCESLYGMRAVHVLVYGTWWFSGLLALIGINVFCAAAVRYPWKRHQTGFVITHAGILTILVGSLLTQQFGVDGSLPVVEGESGNEVSMNDLVLTVFDGNDGARDFTFPETAMRRDGKQLEIGLGNSKRLVVDSFIPRATSERRFEPSPIGGVGLPALHVELFNSRFRVDEWLQPQGPRAPQQISMGPAILTFRTLWTAADEKAWLADDEGKRQNEIGRHGFLYVDWQGRQYQFPVADAERGWRPIDTTGLEVKVDRYLPYAIVQNNELVNKAPEPVNPAVQLSLRGKNGIEEKHTVFALFPEFATLHKRTANHPSGVRFRMIAASQGESAEGGRPRGELHFAQSVDGKKLYYRVRRGTGPKAFTSQGVAKPGEEIVTGWMDLRFKVLAWMDHAVEQESPIYVETISGGDPGLSSAVHLRVEDGAVGSGDGAPQAASFDTGFWLFEGAPRRVPFGNRDLTVVFSKRRMTLPFSLQLEKFTMGTDPGTRKAASYESRVQVRDPNQKSLKESVLISMNEPLVHGGYTFYQASYSLEEGRAPMSIFSVNRDPGRIIKYLGSLIMTFGICLMFYMNPHYWDKVFLVSRKEGAAS